jgi:hypothetical protein
MENLSKNKRGDYRGMKLTLPKNIKGKSNGNWKGGIHYRKDGYILVRIGVFPRNYKGKRYNLLHRMVMEQFLNRPLLSFEVVHHKNGDVTDNRIENLELTIQSRHAKKHYKSDKKTGRFIK